MDITEIVPQSDFVLFVRTEDGQTGLFDVKPYLDGEVFQALNDLREFQRVRNRKYFVEWDCGADLSADTIVAKLQPVTTNGQE